MSDEYVLTPLSDLQEMADTVRSATGSSDPLTFSQLKTAITSGVVGGSGVRIFSTTSFYINDVEYTQSKDTPVSTYLFDSNSTIIIKDSTNTTIIATVNIPSNGVTNVAIPNSYHVAGSNSVPVFDKEVVTECIKYNVHEECLPLGSQIITNKYFVDDLVVSSFTEVSDYSIGTQSQELRTIDPYALWANMSGYQKLNYNDNLYFILRGADLGVNGTSDYVLALLDTVGDTIYHNLDDVVSSDAYEKARVFKKKGSFDLELQIKYGIQLYNPVIDGSDTSVSRSSCRVYKVDMRLPIQCTCNHFESVLACEYGTQTQIPRFTDSSLWWKSLTSAQQRLFLENPDINLYFIAMGSRTTPDATSCFAITFLRDSDLENLSNMENESDRRVQLHSFISPTDNDYLVYGYHGSTSSIRTKYGIELYNPVTGNIDYAVSSNSYRLYKFGIDEPPTENPIYATLIGHNIDRNSNNQIVPITYMIDVPMTFPMNITHTNIGGYGATDFRNNQLSLVKDRIINSELLECLTTLRKSYWKTIDGSGDTEISRTATYEKIDDILIPPSEVELFNSHQYAGGPSSLNQEGHHYPFFDNTENLSFGFNRFNNKHYWTRSTTNSKTWYDPDKGEQLYFVGFNGWTSSSYYGAATEQYLRLLFGFRSATDCPSAEGYINKVYCTLADPIYKYSEYTPSATETQFDVSVPNCYRKYAFSELNGFVMSEKITESSFDTMYDYFSGLVGNYIEYDDTIWRVDKVDSVDSIATCTAVAACTRTVLLGYSMDPHAVYYTNLSLSQIKSLRNNGIEYGEYIIVGESAPFDAYRILDI